MSKKKAKDKKSLPPRPKSNRQIPNSMIRPITAIGQSPALQHAREYPIYGCWIMTDWQKSGMAPIVVAREQESERIMFGVYMVDIYCLGIKDAFTRTDYTHTRFERELPSFCAGNPEPCSVELVHEIIYGAMEYAANLGFQPHADFKYQKADLILDPPNIHPRADNVSFGKNGKPCFISGPYDDKQKCMQIFNILLHNCGKGNFDYLVGLNNLLDDFEDDFEQE